MSFWDKFRESLKLNRCPLLDPKDVEELDRIKRLNRLLGK